MAKIVIDARESGTSTGRYIDKLISHLYELHPKHNVTVLVKPNRMPAVQGMAPGFDLQPCPYEEFTFAEQFAFKEQLEGLNPDLVHFGMTQQPVWYRGRTVTTAHDLTTARFTNPDKQPIVYRFKQQVYKWVIKKVAQKADKIIVPTGFVKQDLTAFTGVDSAKIAVTYESADAITDAPEPIEDLENKQFIMYVGRPTPHKNLDRLIEAYREVRAQHPGLYLVLAGKLDANYRAIQQKYQTKQNTNIIFTDFVSEGQLRWLYEHCAAYVFPSLSEGFGLPGLEAMAHGAPVISSNATCLPEVYGNAAHYFDPVDVQQMADAINEVITSEQLRDQLIAAGHKQAAKYSWRRMAEQTLAIYNEVLQGK